MTKINVVFLIFIIIFLLTCGNSTRESIITNSLNININYKYKIMPSSLKLLLLSQYTEEHYGSPIIYLDKPQMIVVHSTETPNLSIAVNIFKNDKLIGRPDIESGGNVNVGTHFLVDTDGTIYANTPTDYIVRHTVGFNHTAISIENVGYADKLTKEQLEANAKLIKYLKIKYRSIKYIIAHYEYKNKSSPHYSLYKELNTKYINPGKRDPGTNFMTELRKKI